MSKPIAFCEDCGAPFGHAAHCPRLEHNMYTQVRNPAPAERHDFTQGPPPEPQPRPKRDPRPPIDATK